MVAPDMPTDSEIPWWALPLLDYPVKSPKYRVRRDILRGHRPAENNPKATWTATWWEVWREVWKDLQTKAAPDPKEWPAQVALIREGSPDIAARAALMSSRAFVQYVDLRDDQLQPVLIKDFQARIVNAIRTTRLSEILIPMYHGKTWLGSMLVPLMDWAENPECSEIRIYKSEDFTIGMARNLMVEIERNEALHRLFPHVQKPERGDAAHKDWSTERFSIKGKVNLINPSFRPLTWAKGATGVRADRVGGDDWVNDENDDSQNVQERMDGYFNSGVQTMPTFHAKRTTYDTLFGTLFYTGTIFHRQDLGARIRRRWMHKDGRKVIRIDVFPRKDSEAKGEVIWPEFRPYHWIKDLKESMGPRAFDMRLRNRPQGDDGTQGFDADSVRNSVSETWAFGQAPPAMPVIVGFDPATSKRTKHTKYPAVVVLGMGADGEIHLIEWHRWGGKVFPSQVDGLIDISKRFGYCPVAVEDNQTQLSYAEQITHLEPRVRVFTHSTQLNKRHPTQGVETYVPLFTAGKVVIHGVNAPKENLDAILSEFLDWPQSEYIDLVMACWIGKRQYELHNSQEAPEGYLSELPSGVYRRGLNGFLDISALKSAAR